MRTVQTPVYKFEELSDDAKQKAIEHLYDINVAFDWWDSTYDDAKQIGCEIHEFDTGRSNSINLKCLDAHETARLIVENHGETCDTRKLADEYLKDFDALARDEDGEVLNGDALYDLDKEFERARGEEYLSMLRQEYEYQTSEEAILETIEANEYEFLEDGKIF